MSSFIVAMARRESRGSRRRLALYMGSITLGVAALVAINSFRQNVTRAIADQARELLGADLELHSRHAFDPAIDSLLDSLRQARVPISRATSFASMALAPRTGLTRLVEIRAVSGDFPYYGSITTDPPNRWGMLGRGRRALIDPALRVQLDVGVGDTLAIGESRFGILGTVTKSPGDIAIRSAIGPRVYIPAAYLEETQLLRFGSRAEYHAFLKLDGAADVERFINRHIGLLRAHEVGYDTVAEREGDLTRSLDTLARYLGLVGLVALLLGGVGVASAVNVFVKEKLETVAVLRCLGATQRTVFAVYLLQAGLMGLAGAGVGVLLGMAIQSQLPSVLSDFLPVTVGATVQWTAAGAGLGIGVWVALVFALLPLLTIRNVSPLAALRRDYEPVVRRRDPVRLLTFTGLLASIIALALWQAPRIRSGLAFAAGILATTGLLWISALALTRATRRYFPRGARYVVRQGVANLFRPHNQTTAVTLAVGFGIFLVATLYVVQRNLLDQISLDTRPDRPNVVMFDIQTDQLEGVRAVLAARGAPILQQTPIVTARIAAINGQTVAELLRDSSGWRRARWALRREYRNTYRDSLMESEELVAGRWWRPGAPRAPGPWEISMEEGVAEDLHVRLGDRITWDVQGVPVDTRITSLRKVTWARFEPNFFVVFQPGALARAPQMLVILSRMTDLTARAELQRDLVRRYPNIAILDLTLVQETLDTVLGSVAFAIRFMALFSLASGLLVLIGAVATSRFQRMRESVLLKTLGASQRQITEIVLTEYCTLGVLAGATGILLAASAGWALMRFFFEVPFRLPALQLGTLAVAAIVVTTVVGMANSRRVFTSTPLAVIREMAE